MWGQIVSEILPNQKIPGAVNYRFTDEDVLWAARMAAYETVGEDSVPSDKPQQALEVLWTMASLFAYRLKNVCKVPPPGCASQQPRWPTYTKLIQAYSQPINPIWRRDGSKCTGTYQGHQACSGGRLRARDRHATVTLDELREKWPNTMQVVWDWALGKPYTVLGDVTLSLANPIPTSVEFAAPGVSQGFLNRTAGSRLVLKHRNWFISTRYSQRFPPGYIRIVGGGRTRQLLAVVVVGLAGVLVGMFVLG